MVSIRGNGLALTSTLLACAVLAAGCRTKAVEVRDDAAASSAANVPVASSAASARAASASAPSADPAASGTEPSVAPAPALAAPLHLPKQLPSTGRAPLLIMLHGLGSSSDAIEQYSDWPRFAEENGVAWAAPNGPFDRQGRRFWDAGDSCCNFERLPVDHVSLLAELIERLARDARIDRARVFVGGYSNGGFMAHRLACERPALVAGIVSVAGSGPLDGQPCAAATSLRVLQIQGDADPIVGYAGGHLFRDSRLPRHASAVQTIADWADRLGCSGQPTSAEPLDFEQALPGKETRVSRYAGCKRGRIELWTVVGGGHLIGFRSPSPAAIWGALTR